MNTRIPLDGRTASFGSYRLSGASRRLTDPAGEVRLGSRALDLLLTLVERPGEMVSKDELRERVWPGTFVDESNLKVQMTALRRSLKDGEAGNRFIGTVTGRGYVFVCPVEFAETPHATAVSAIDHGCSHNLAAEAPTLVGRDASLRSVAQLLEHHRLVTIVGPPGVGKTAVAVAVADAQARRGAQDVWFVDWSGERSIEQAVSALARCMGLPSQQDILSAVVEALGSRPALLVVDNCEHVLAIAGDLVRRLLSAAPQVRIVATSRETLRVAGERPYLLAPLECPPRRADLTVEQVLRFPAAQLFVERASATKAGFTLRDADAGCLAELCVWLEGLPLAIELLAARADVFGLRGLAMRCPDLLAMSCRGCRPTVPRHGTVTQAFDWSFDLLHPAEQHTFLQISACEGPFGLEEATRLAARDGVTGGEILEHLCALYDSSLIVLDPAESEPRFRLLTPLREYGRAKLGRAAHAASMSPPARSAPVFQSGLSRRPFDAARQPEVSGVAA